MRYKLFLLFGFFVFFSIGFAAIRSATTIDSLRHIINSNLYADTTRLEAYLNLSWELKSVKPQESLEYANEALRLAEKINDRLKTADALSYLGVIYCQKGNFEMALDYHLEARSIYLEVGNEWGFARSNINMGIIFSDQGYYDKALDYFFSALMIYEDQKNKSGMSVVLNNIGMVYEYQQNYELAESYHLESLELKTELGDTKGISFSFNNLGLVYTGMGTYDQALEYFYKALEIRQEFNDSREIANTFNNLGYLYLLLGNYEKSRQYLYNANSLYNEVGDKSGIAKSENHLGKLYSTINDQSRAKQLFLESLQTSKQVGLNRLMTENHLNLAELMAKNGDFERGFYYQKKLIQIKDSLFREDNRQRLSELQVMYDREKRENELQILMQNRQIHLLSSQRDKLLRNFLVVGVILILITLFLLYNRFLIARNANLLLEQQKDEISQSNEKLINLNRTLYEQKKKSEELNHELSLSYKKLKQSEKHLIEVNATKDKFFSIISHDLRNPFAAIVSFSRILKRDISNMTVMELQELARELDKSVLKINNLLENLLQWSRTQTGKINYEPQYLAIHEIVKDNLVLFKNNALEKDIALVDNVADDIPVWADRNMTDTVLRNLLSNALKYTESGGVITVKGEIRDHKAFISVADNGVGMTEESQQKIFRTDTLHSTYGTMDEKGSGIGLLLCKEFVEKQGGDIYFESKPQEGTVFTFSLPLENNIL